MTGTTAAQGTSGETGPAPESPDRRPGTGTALALAAVSIVVPGTAHLRAGRRVVGGLLLGCYLVAAAVAVALLLTRRQMLLRFVVQPRWLTGIQIAAVVAALAWVLLVWRSYRVLRPQPLPAPRRVLAGLTVGVLCLVACVPFAAASRYAGVQRDLVTSVFNNDDTHDSGGASPWGGKQRVNILLIGGDAGKDRSGVRTDSVTLASVNTRTGAAVLLGLPRNMEHVPFPAGPARDRFPDGFPRYPAPGYEGLLNEIYRYGREHPHLVPGSAQPGADLLKGVVGQVLGVHVDYYVLVNMWKFADIVDAIGGLKLRIAHPIPYGERGQVLTPGYRRLNGAQVLWYGRSRTNSSDYVRMGRQKCVLAALAEQASPQTVLRRFQSLASATKHTVSTDIPQQRLPDLVDLAAKIRKADIRSLMFVPPRVDPADPDWAKIRSETGRALTGDHHSGEHRSARGHHKDPSTSLHATCPKP